MKKNIPLVLISLALVTGIVCCGCQAKQTVAAESGGHYASVNGIKLYYTVSGSGKPILLIHGNGEDHTIFDKLIKKLQKNYTVYAADSRDHGRSTKVSPLTYADTAKDYAEFIDAVIGEKTIVYGFSDGGIIGLLLAADYPENIEKIIVSGANTRPDTLKWYARAGMKIQSIFKRNEKLDMMLTQPDITAKDLKRIAVPSVVLAGEHDLIKESDTRFIAANISNSTLEIIKGENHGSYIVHSDKIYNIIKKYL